MAFPLCKLITLTGPQGFPTRVVLSNADGAERFQLRQKVLTPVEGLETMADFDNDDLIPFQNAVQLKFGLNELGGSRQDFGVVIVNTDELNKELTQRFSGTTGVFYVLTYKVLP